jgi:hypothetical protein
MLVLSIPNIHFPFNIKTDASNYVLGAMLTRHGNYVLGTVLTQHGHPITFHLEICNDIIHRCCNYEK